MAGNSLGPRRLFAYTSDTGETYSILTDQSLGVAAGLTESDAHPAPPRRNFKPRVVFAEAIVGGQKLRRALICDATSPIFEDVATNVTIDSVVFRTKGRRGECFSYGSNPPSA